VRAGATIYKKIIEIWAVLLPLFFNLFQSKGDLLIDE